jgi:hypothetical protein
MVIFGGREWEGKVVPTGFKGLKVAKKNGLSRHGLESPIMRGQGWYVHVATAFPLAHHYRAVLGWQH